jgi:TrmH family RNA methyltransferase
MGETLITSAANPIARRMRALGERKHRRAEGACVVEGIRPVWQALEHGAEVESLIVAPELLTSEAARGMVEQAQRRGTPVALFAAALFERLSEREHPAGLAAIVRTPRRTLDALPVDRGGLYVAVNGPGSPGNLGTILRTVDAVGGSGMILMGRGTDPYHPTAVKASMGTVFAVPTAEAADIWEALAWCRAHGMRAIATSGETGQPHWSISYAPPCLLLFGSEGAGLPTAAREACAATARIPMAGSAGSLNLAVAAGVILYEARRATWLAQAGAMGEP